jgi:methylmalonyl-CoA/ethylmalonyl-CoA epimerase
MGTGNGGIMGEQMRIHHIAVAVNDIDKALEFYRDGLGLEMTTRRDIPEEGVEIAFLPIGEAEIELIRPLDPENSIGRFLTRRGEGMHHICVLVNDIDCAVQRLVTQGATMATEIRSHPDGRQYAFVHPKSTHGVLLELYQDKSEA